LRWEPGILLDAIGGGGAEPGLGRGNARRLGLAETHEQPHLAIGDVATGQGARLKGERGWLLERIAAVPDLTLEEIRAELRDRGIHVGYGTVWRFFAAEDISFKKNRARQRARAP
jgi:transposase